MEKETSNNLVGQTYTYNYLCKGMGSIYTKNGN